MRDKILQFVLVLAYVSQVCSQNSDNSLSGMFVVATKGTPKIVRLNKTNKSEIMLTLTNYGELVDGMINTNISNSYQLNSAFMKIRKLKVKTTCNILDYSLFLVRFCEKDKQDQDNQDFPKGRYNSTIQIFRLTSFFNGQFTIKFSFVVDYKVEMYDKKKYTTCFVKQLKKKFKKIENESNVDIKSFEVKEGRRNEMAKKDEEKELKDPKQGIKSKENLTLMNFERPIFIKITLRPTRKLNDLKQGEDLYYAFFDFKNKCVLIKAGKFENTPETSNKSSIRIDEFDFIIEALAKNGEHTFLIYDKRIWSPRTTQLGLQEELLTADQAVPRQMKLYYNCGASNKITIEKMPNVTKFLFELPQNKLKRDNFSTIQNELSLDQLGIYISDEKKDHLINTPYTSYKSTVMKHKTTLGKCFYNKKDSSNTVIPENQIKTFEQVRKFDCSLKKTLTEQWLMDDYDQIDLQFLTNNNAVYPNKSYAVSKLVTCGILAFEVSRQNKYDSNLKTADSVFVFFQKTQKSMNENGKKVVEVDKSKDKLKKRELLLKGDKNANMTYETIELIEPTFEKNVQAAIADVKKSIVAKHGKSIWKNAEYKSELKVIRRVACSGKGCQASVRAVLQYNLTKKAEQKRLVLPQHKRILKILVAFPRFRFNFKLQERHLQKLFSKTLIKRKYPHKYHAGQMPMTKVQEAATPIETTKSTQPSLPKFVLGSSLKKLKASDTGCLFARLLSKFRKNKKFFKGYQRQMVQYNQRENKNPLFEIINNKNYQYRDTEVFYPKELKKTGHFKETRPNNYKLSGSAHALTIRKCIIIAVINCLFLFVY